MLFYMLTTSFFVNTKNTILIILLVPLFNCMHVLAKQQNLKTKLKQNSIRPAVSKCIDFGVHYIEMQPW